MLTDAGPGDRRVPDPAHHLLRRLLLRDGRLRRPGAARHHLSRALGLHLAARPADLLGRRRRRRDPPAGARARPRRAAVPGRADRARRAAWSCPAFTKDDGSPRYPGGYPDYIVNHERTARASARWPAGAARTAARPARARRTRDQLERYIENGCFWQDELPPRARYFKHANRAYLDYAVRMGFIGQAEPIMLQLYCEPLQRFRLAARGPRRGPAARARPRAHPDLLRPAAVLVPAVRGRGAATRRASRCTRSPSGRWRCTTPGARRTPGCARSTAATGSTSTARRAAALGLADDDWVWVESRHGRIKVPAAADGRGQARHRLDLERDRQARRRLEPRRRRARSAQGFLLNHLIAELLPEREGGYRYANADPVTGQAAGTTCACGSSRRPRTRPAPARRSSRVLRPPPGLAAAPDVLRYGAGFRRDAGGARR